MNFREIFDLARFLSYPIPPTICGNSLYLIPNFTFFGHVTSPRDPVGRYSQVVISENAPRNHDFHEVSNSKFYKKKIEGAHYVLVLTTSGSYFWDFGERPSDPALIRIPAERDTITWPSQKDIINIRSVQWSRTSVNFSLTTRNL